MSIDISSLFVRRNQLGTAEATTEAMGQNQLWGVRSYAAVDPERRQ